MKIGPLELALGPLLLLQGRWVRLRTPRLPEPEGPRVGTSGRGPHLRLLVAGDSAAAGVGARTWEEGLTARLVAELAPLGDVAWRLEAATGATTADTSARLARLRGTRFDVLVTSLGVNDLTSGVDLSEWIDQQRSLRAVARDVLGIRLQLVAGLPPVGGFPALPQPLRWYLGRRARAFTRALREDLRSDRDARFVDLRLTDEVTWMAPDGFHPGPRVYAAWAERLAQRLVAEGWIGSRSEAGDPILDATGGAGRPSRRTRKADRR